MRHRGQSSWPLIPKDQQVKRAELTSAWRMLLLIERRMMSKEVIAGPGYTHLMTEDVKHVGLGS